VLLNTGIEMINDPQVTTLKVKNRKIRVKICRTDYILGMSAVIYF